MYYYLSSSFVDHFSEGSFYSSSVLGLSALLLLPASLDTSLLNIMDIWQLNWTCLLRSWRINDFSDSALIIWEYGENRNVIGGS